MPYNKCHVLTVIWVAAIILLSVVNFSTYQRNLETKSNSDYWTGQKTTLVTMAYNSKRQRNWKYMLAEYCEMVDIFDRILFVWQNVSAPCPTLHPCKVEVRCLATSQNSMNNRYYYSRDVRTRTTFSVDDDVVVPRDLVLKLLRASYRSDLVGLDARSFGSDGTYSFWGFTYANKLVLPKTWVLPVHYWNLYWQDHELLQFIDAGNACEDLAMNFVFRNYTQQNPVIVYDGFFSPQRQSLREAGGLSITGNRWNWSWRRSLCIKWLLRHFPKALVE